MASTTSPPIVFVIGGTGAQGLPVVRDLVKDGAYAVRFLTRDPSSARARSLTALPNVEAVEGTFANEEDLRRGFRGATFAFVNIDGFNTGEKTEIFWAIRTYELAIEEGIKFYVYGNLDYGYKKGGFDPKFRTGHYDGKGRIAEWILMQNKDPIIHSKMRSAIFTTGPYMSMAIASHTPMSPIVEDDIVTWRVPLASGAVPHVDLDDCGYYVRWLFDNQSEADGLDLEVAIDFLDYNQVAKAYEIVAGHPARFIDTSMEEYWTTGPFGQGLLPAGYNADPSDVATMSMKQNFTGFWNVFRHCKVDNTGILKRDFALLDRIHPHRVKSAEEWFRKEEKKGIDQGFGSLWDRVNTLKPVLKIAEDKRQGRL